MLDGGGHSQLFSVAVRAAGEVAEIELHGELDLASVDTLTATFLGLASPRTREIVVDLAHLAFIDCAGLRVIVDAAERFAANGIGLVLRSPTPLVRRVLDLTGVSSELTIESPE